MQRIKKINYLEEKYINEKELKEVLIEYLTKKLINDQISLQMICILLKMMVPSNCLRKESSELKK